MPSPVEQIKSRLEIVQVIGDYLKLEKAGINHRARCPFHNEKTPSFFVSATRQSYHCFGCGKGGDLISFVQEIEGLDFKGALQVLADRAGIKLEAMNPGESSAKIRLYDLVQSARDYYQSQLKSNKLAQEYLKLRGLLEPIIEAMGLGSIGEEWQDLCDYLKNQGYTSEEIIKAGLGLKNQSGRIYDRFRGRLMFPLADQAGRPVGFSGRIFPPEREKTEKMGKYVNSPETPLYDKSKLLYLYDRAKLTMRQSDRAILVEGQFDALLSHQAGLTETVAASGTALSPYHLNLIKRLTNKLIMAFDGDLAGLRASARAIGLALDQDMEVRVALLPAGQDPADLIRANPSAWREAVDKSKHVIEFLIESVARSGADRRTLGRQMESVVFPYLLRLASPLDQAHFIDEIGKTLGLPTAAVEASLNRARRSAPRPMAAAGQPLDPEVVDGLAAIRREIFALYFWAETLKSPTYLEWQKELCLWWGEDKLTTWLKAAENKKADLLLAAEMAYDKEHLDLSWREIFLRLQELELRAELAALTGELRQLEQAGDQPKIETYLKRCRDISTQLSQLVK